MMPLRHTSLLLVLLGLLSLWLGLSQAQEQQPQVGYWEGTAQITSEELDPAASLSFVLDSDGALVGSLRVELPFVDETSRLALLMGEYGCLLAFEGLESGPVQGQFSDNKTAAGTLTLEGCFLQGYGEVLLLEEATGTWQAEWVAEQAPSNPAPLINLSLRTDVPRGQALYEYHCAVCHGVNGEGTDIAPTYTDYPVLPTDFIASRVRGGPEVMSAFTEEQIPEDDLALIADYIQTNFVGTALRAYTEAEVLQGKEIYKTYCTECHGIFGTGKNDLGPAINLYPPYSASRIIAGALLPLPSMPRLSITPEELDLVVAYLHNLAMQ